MNDENAKYPGTDKLLIYESQKDELTSLCKYGKDEKAEGGAMVIHAGLAKWGLDLENPIIRSLFCMFNLNRVVDLIIGDDGNK
jgi:hypothetical protein